MQVFSHLQQNITQMLERLSQRERVLVIATSIFVVVSILGSLVWSVHQAATREQQRVNDLKDLMVWMQTHAASMKSDQESQLSLQDKIQRVSQQQGLSLSSTQQGEQIQIVAVHAEYAVLANLLTQLAKMGVNLQKIQMLDEGNQLKLTAVVG
jgi:predicted PurR-regulated permease PerM